MPYSKGGNQYQHAFNVPYGINTSQGQDKQLVV